MTSSAATWQAVWEAEAARPLTGWDWRCLRDRRTVGPLPWDYDALAVAALRQARAALDVGTGGGERLARWQDAFPPRMEATEGWPPNVEVATRRLAPLGVTVHATVDGVLPHPASSFDLVLNRRAACREKEVARVLEPGGLFLTEQMDRASRAPYAAAFGRAPPGPDGTLAQRVEALVQAGFVLERAERHLVSITYRDVGALVLHLSGMPWIVPGFSVAADLHHLLALQARVERGEPLTFTRAILLLRARRPGP
jgi:SAM-dependent methyltransferase